MKLWSSLRDISSRNVRRAGAVITAVAVGLALMSGCLNRPVIEQTPQTSNVFVDQIRQTAIDKIDLLFVIDNSISMADKQEILAIAVPGLVERLVNPDCVRLDAAGAVSERMARSGGDCPEGWDIEFNPVDDIHIGVITSSLGGHGGDFCSQASPASWNETQNDRARLLPTVRPEAALPSDDGAGFLAWQGGTTGRSREDLKAAFAQHVRAAGEVGCGYEATLEAWYRFLIDPSPPLDIVVVDNAAMPAQDANGIILDTTLLAQRNAFLRPDSLVAIIVLTDENDCSVVDGGIGWLTAASVVNGGTFTMPYQSTTCDTNANDKCCYSCGVSKPEGCPDDPNCVPEQKRPSAEDALNLRCYNQKQRFGFDLLYPIERYVAGLRDVQVYDYHKCDANGCPLVDNPLFAVRDAQNPRDPSLVFFAGIVGVPWQDIATEASLGDPELLEYMTATELTDNGRWDVILGSPEADNYYTDPNLKPLDPLMHEQPDPRTGTNPITQEPLAPETSTDPNANSINGHEYLNDKNNDLQYACIFPLTAPRDCADTANTACDCLSDDDPKNRPLCNPPGGGPAGRTQYAAKAYPGTRLLHALRDFGSNSIVASICPKVTDPNTVEGGDQNAAFGYNPAVAAIIDRLKEVLGGRCLPRQLVPDDGQVPCAVVEATRTENPCDPALGRGPVNDAVVPAVHKQLQASGSCGGTTQIPCDSYHLCEILQLTGDAQTACLNEIDYPTNLVPGYCYIDEAQGIGNPQLLVGCPATEQRKLQFVGKDTPLSGSITFIACVGAAFSDDKGDPNE